jgi:hypothetical protein
MTFIWPPDLKYELGLQAIERMSRLGVKGRKEFIQSEGEILMGFSTQFRPAPPRNALVHTFSH